MSNLSYHEQKNIEYTTLLRELLSELPPFCKDYFRGIDQTTAAKTKISYAYDLKIFFEYLKQTNPLYKDYKLRDFTLNDLSKLEILDIEEYQEYLKLYSMNNKQITNSEQGLARKLSSLRSFLHYYYKHKFIKYNPAKLIDMPKIHDKTIVKLDADEVAMLLDYMEKCSENLTPKQKAYYDKTKYRDIAIITLMLGTGIRVSECVGLDIDDVDFRNNGIKLVRKGGNEMIVYFGEEVENALYDYLTITRNTTAAIEGHEDALFLSMQRKRISVRAVEDLVKKYASAVTPNKNITPHKLRSTYGTTLYRETGDIYLVADVLGHRDVNTTKKHYAQMEDENRRKAARAVTLREKDISQEN